MEDASDEDFNEMIQTTTDSQNLKKFPIKCKVCDAPAFKSYVGVIVCPSCKTFFRRNAQKTHSRFKCFDDGDCEIDTNNRPMCTSCRLAKCLASGMQVELIRASRTSTDNTQKKKQMTTTSTVLMRLKEQDQPEHLSTLNLLQEDQSILTIDQWNLLSNLTHCYDEYSKFSLAQRFIQEQNELPPKMRFKSAAVGEFVTSIIDASQLLYIKNADFTSLCSHDRTILLHNTMEYVTALSTCFIIRHTRLLDDPGLYKSTESLYGPHSVGYSYRAIGQLDFDGTFFKLVLALLTFSTYNYTCYKNMPPVNLKNKKAVLRIHDMYTELAWRYLLYKFGHERAVIYFSNLIRCIFLVHNAVIAMEDCKQYTDMIDSLVKQTEETLTLIE